MKNKFVLVMLVTVVLLLTGCEATSLKCTATYDDTIKYSVKITANIKNKKVSNATLRMTFKNSEDASNMCELNKLNTNKNVLVSCYEKEVIIRNYENLLSASSNGITKDDFVKELKAQGFKF